MIRYVLMLSVSLALAACGGDESGLPAVGTLERDRIEVVAEAHEILLELSAHEGQHVQAGELLARQDDARIRIAVARAEAARARASRRMDELVRGPRREEIAEAQARLEGARSREQVEEREYERMQSILARGLASPTELDEALARRDAALAERRQLEARLEALLQGTTLEELDQARAALAEAEAALQDAELGAERLQLRAPRDAVVDALPFRRGDRPPAGAVVVVLLADDAPYARVYVPQAVRAKMQLGMAARVRVDGLEREFAGELRTIAAEASFTPYFALTERDRGRLSYVAEVTLVEQEATGLPTGLPVEVDFPDLAERP